jgi:folate-binding protein YgfZ
MTTNFIHRCQLDRTIVRLNGPDRHSFLQGLVSCDVNKADQSKAVYGAFLSPQGKFLHDFFCLEDTPENESLLIDIRADRADDFIRRLKPFRLRSKVDITIDLDLGIAAIFSDAPIPTPQTGRVFQDPRLVAMGWREITSAQPATDPTPYNHHRIRLGIGEAVDDLLVDKTILIEGNFDVLNGIDFQKGCYMGQEVTARTHYRGLVKKRLFPCRIDGLMPEMGSIIYIDDREIGEIRSGYGHDLLAYLKIELVGKEKTLTVDINGQSFKITTDIPIWLEKK